jgi:RimJ/RimL family protein N-acetyltransferase
MRSFAVPEFHIETPRLTIRALQVQDQRLFCELFTDIVTMRFIGQPLSALQAERRFRAALRANASTPQQDIFLQMTARPTQQPVGLCSVQHLNLTLRRAELGVMVCRVHRRAGLGKEALCGLVRAAFGLFPIDRAWVQYDVGNLAAERLFASSGFSPELVAGGHEGGAAKHIWSIHRRAWSARQTANFIGEDACRM